VPAHTCPSMPVTQRCCHPIVLLFLSLLSFSSFFLFLISGVQAPVRLPHFLHPILTHDPVLSKTPIRRAPGSGRNFYLGSSDVPSPATQSAPTAVHVERDRGQRAQTGAGQQILGRFYLRTPHVGLSRSWQHDRAQDRALG